MTSLVARYTNDEKILLYSLFQQYEEVIDIKYRKNSPVRKNSDVRDCWNNILNAYNSNPKITTLRNLKQIQKFWLNARLRNRFPKGIAKEINKIKRQNTLGKKKTNENSIILQQLKEEHPYVHDTTVVDLSSEQITEIDEITPDKLTLNDLLDFKTIDTQNENTETEEIVSDTFPHQHQQQLKTQETRNTQRTNELIERDITESNPCNSSCCCKHRNSTRDNNVDDRLHYFKEKEAELKYKEQELRCEQQKIELTKRKEELIHMREYHMLQIEEMKIKLNILREDEFKIKNNKPNLGA